MLVSTAIDLVNSLVYKPGWEFTAEDHRNRFEGSIRIRIDYPAYQSERKDAYEGYPNEIKTYATFAIVVEDCNDVISLYRRILEKVIEIETHEAREFLRIAPTMWAPFHPHRIDGMKRYGEMERDLQFGLA